MRKTKLTYSYDKTTGRGNGILTIKRKTAAVTSDTLLIYAAGLPQNDYSEWAWNSRFQCLLG